MSGKKRDRKRALALIMASAFFFVMIYFTLYEGEHVLHECSNDHCAVCQELAIIDSVLKQTLIVLPVVISCLVKAFYGKENNTVLFCDLLKRTLILDKVRIDD